MCVELTFDPVPVDALLSSWARVAGDIVAVDVLRI